MNSLISQIDDILKNSLKKSQLFEIYEMFPETSPPSGRKSLSELCQIDYRLRDKLISLIFKDSKAGGRFECLFLNEDQEKNLDIIVENQTEENDIISKKITEIEENNKENEIFSFRRFHFTFLFYFLFFWSKLFKLAQNMLVAIDKREVKELCRPIDIVGTISKKPPLQKLNANDENTNKKKLTESEKNKNKHLRTCSEMNNQVRERSKSISISNLKESRAKTPDVNF